MITETKKKEGKTEKTTAAHAGGKLVAVRIRGNLRQSAKEAFALRLLKLPRVHSCSVMDDTQSMRGLLAQAGHVVAWGELDDALHETLKKKYVVVRPGKMYTGTINWLTLHPPQGGYERKGRKISFLQSGAIGYRGKDINTLIQRML